MSQQVTYEVHVKQSGRWEIEARHEADGKDVAIEEAKELDAQKQVEEVKVVRELYDLDTGNTREYVIYKTPGASARQAAEAKHTSEPADRRGYSGSNDSHDRVRPTASRRPIGRPAVKKKTTFVGFIVKVLLVILASITLAGLMSGGVVTYLRDTSLSSNVQSNIFFAVFVIFFLVTSIGLSMSFLRKEELKESDLHLPAIRPMARRPAAPPKPRKKMPEKKKPEKKKEKKKAPEDTEEEEEDLRAYARKQAEELDLLDIADDILEEEPEEEPEDEPVPDEEADDEPEELSEIDDAPLSPHAEKQRVYLMQFLSSGLGKMNAEMTKLDSFNKFGLNLYLAGACEIMGQQRNLDNMSSAKILAETVSLMGFKPDDAKNFAGKYEDYLLADSRYMQMFQAGRNAMSSTLEGTPDADKYLEESLTEWNKPKQKEDNTGPVTVLFTDIAGSTAMTQTLGDAVAQQIVRAHNRVVREALTDCSGKEIKHTGDGIMASFSTTSNGVEGAIQMQKGVAKHNENNPDLPLKIKIGINAGEPISEDNDLFGSTVQMAARIVDKAKANEIFVSEIVRGICVGKQIKFKNRGPYEMKGFDDPPILYEVEWEE